MDRFDTNQMMDRILGSMKRQEEWLQLIYQEERRLMALGQDILAAVQAETTSVDSVIALINGLVANSTIPPDVGKAILDEIGSQKAKLDAAITANTPQSGG